MVSTIEKLVVKIGVDTNEFNKGMANVSRNLKDTGQKMAKVGSTMTKRVTLPVVAGFAAISKAAMDLEATGAKYETVFAGMTDVVDNYIKEFQKLTPATTAEARSMASGIQDLLVPMGFMREEATAMTGEFLHVSGALANFNSGTHTSQEVVNAMQSAITGMFMPLKRLGIQLDATTVKEKAVEMGLADTKDEVTKQIEAQVILAEIYNQSGDALDAYTEANLDAKTKSGLLKTEIVDAAAKIGTILLPIITNIVDKVSIWVDKFDNLDENTQKMILRTAGIVAALGPLLFIIGKIVGTAGALSGIMAGAGTAVAGAGVAASTAATAILPFVAGIVAAVGAGVLLYKYFSKDVIPEVERFGDEVSDSTQQAVGAFMDLEEKATNSLNEMAWGGMSVTEEMAANLVGTFSQMKEQIVAELEEQKNATAGILQELFDESTDITQEEIDEMVRISEEGYDERIKTTEDGAAAIVEILNLASEENREITQFESDEITRIKREMKNAAVEIMSENELEQAAIMERMRANANSLSAQQAAEVVANSVAARDGSVAAAEDAYSEQLNGAIQLRADGTEESAAMADEIIAEAQRQREEAVVAATDMHEDIVEQAKLQANEHVSQVDWETGEILSKWAFLVDELKRYAREAGGATAAMARAPRPGGGGSSDYATTAGAAYSIGYATGTNFVPEDGLAYLHKGEAIVPADINAQNRGTTSGGTIINIYPQEMTASQTDYLFNKFNARLGVEI